MNRVLKISTILTWINIIIWGLVILSTTVIGILFHSMALLVIAFLFSVIVLHAYAVLQLHKSIRNPAIPLSSQTPIGIRFIGFIALFFGFSYLADGFAALQNPADLLHMMQAQLPQLKGANTASVRAGGVLALFLGFCISLNVFLNFRLLRWYYFLRDNAGK